MSKRRRAASRRAATTAVAVLAAATLIAACGSSSSSLGLVQNILDLENAPNYWIDAINGGVILFALFLARVIGGEASAE